LTWSRSSKRCKWGSTTSRTTRLPKLDAHAAHRSESIRTHHRSTPCNVGTEVAEGWLTQAQALTAVNAGQLQLARKFSQRAVELALREEQPERAVVGDGSAVLGNVHSAYVRGEAFLTIGRASEALSDFQKLLDHPGLCFNDPLRTLSQLQIGRGYALVGDRIKARSAYEAFFRGGNFLTGTYRF
jgi:hypothetical protein